MTNLKNLGTAKAKAGKQVNIVAKVVCTECKWRYFKILCLYVTTFII